MTTDVLKPVYVVNDLDGDRVLSSFRWFRDGTPISDGIGLSPDYTRKGDRIEVALTATDGRGPSTETAIVTIQNTEPAIVGLTVLPPSPTTADDLVPNVQIEDPDEEEFEFVYDWRINGVVSDHTGPVLPAGEHRRGDSVELALTVSDGEASDSSRTVIEILDASPRVAVAALPQSAMYGDLVSFEASAWDPDGDPVGDARFQVNYGPPGMKIDPQTGTVTWDAAVTMFGRPMEFQKVAGVAQDPLPFAGLETPATQPLPDLRQFGPDDPVFRDDLVVESEGGPFHDDVPTASWNDDIRLSARGLDHFVPLVARL